MSAFVVETYQSHSSEIVEVITQLLNKVQSEIDDTRHADYNAAHNFAMLRQFLEEQLTQDIKALEKAKAEFVAAFAKEKNGLAETLKRLVFLKVSQAVRQSTNSQEVSEHDISVKDFAEQLKTLAAATQMIQDQTGRIKSQTYSLFQESSKIGLQMRTEHKEFKVVHIGRKLAKEEHSENEDLQTEDMPLEDVPADTQLDEHLQYSAVQVVNIGQISLGFAEKGVGFGQCYESLVVAGKRIAGNNRAAGGKKMLELAKDYPYDGKSPEEVADMMIVHPQRYVGPPPPGMVIFDVINTTCQVRMVVRQGHKTEYFTQQEPISLGGKRCDRLDEWRFGVCSLKLQKK